MRINLLGKRSNKKKKRKIRKTTKNKVGVRIFDKIRKQH